MLLKRIIVFCVLVITNHIFEEFAILNQVQSIVPPTLEPCMLNGSKKVHGVFMSEKLKVAHLHCRLVSACAST